MPYERIYIGIDGAWHFQEKQLDFYNARVDWTVSENVALGIEYRHRSRFDWRKADFYNFILESTRTQAELLASPLSDRRDTLLFRLFTRLTPIWTAKFDLRHGWHREFQGPYFEYQIEMYRIIFQHWKLCFKYEKRGDRQPVFILPAHATWPSLQKKLAVLHNLFPCPHAIPPQLSIFYSTTCCGVIFSFRFNTEAQRH